MAQRRFTTLPVETPEGPMEPCLGVYVLAFVLVAVAESTGAVDVSQAAPGGRSGLSTAR